MGLDDVADLEITIVWLHHVFFFGMVLVHVDLIWSKLQQSKYVEQIEMGI